MITGSSPSRPRSRATTSRPRASNGGPESPPGPRSWLIVVFTATTPSRPSSRVRSAIASRSSSLRSGAIFTSSGTARPAASVAAVRTASTEAAGRAVPLLVKIAPDLSDEDLDAIADLTLELGLDGVVAVNTTINHDLGPGGLSGPPLLARGLEVVARLRGRLGDEPVIMGCGGITTVADAQRYLDAGATLVQGYTGLIYQGPFWGSRINRGLLRSRRV